MTLLSKNPLYPGDWITLRVRVDWTFVVSRLSL